MQNKQPHQGASARNMTGIYLGMEGSPARFTHISAVPPLFRRRSLERAKTSVEYQRYKKIEMLRLIESRPGFKGAVVKPKVKSVSPEVELHPHFHTKSPLLTAEQLRSLTRRVLRDFAIPEQSNGDMSGRRSKSSGLLNGPKKPPNSSRQSNIQGLSIVMNPGRTDDPYRITFAKQELMRTKPGYQEVCESAVPFHPERSNHNRQLRSSGAHHLLLNRYLQSSQAFTRTEQPSRAAKAHLQSTSEDKMILPSASVSGSPMLLSRKPVPLGRSHLAGKWGHTESGFPGLNSTLRRNLIPKTLELKQRSDGNDSSKQVLTTAVMNDTRAANGSGRMDTLKSKATSSVKVRAPVNSEARTLPHSEINDQSPGGKKEGETDASEHTIQEPFKEENSEDLAAELSDLRKLESSQLSNFNDDEEDEEELEMDSTMQLAKQIEVIINLKTKVDSSDCSSEKDLEHRDSNEAQI
ncbi:uncharacterized protein LOC119971465 [Scyliorhinus canicula]|uniref:uncharacterized protein LOC119971465 n=1 Tax=Scyliorhinus canicula TaxID=7830 RepID=UPI0018F4C9F4|nr:uncharacterized protein LOC119971465 [Scyliorhinus canicula]